MPKRIGLFMDVSNLYYTIGDHYSGHRLNYARALDYVKGFGDVTMSVAYGANRKGQANPFIKMLQRIGFRTKYKEVKIQGTVAKANWDVGMAVDIMKSAENLDMIFLGSADGDFAPLAEYLVELGKVVVVFARAISKEFVNVATECIEIPESLLDKKETRNARSSS